MQPFTQAAAAGTVGVLFILSYITVYRARYILWMGCTFLAIAVGVMVPAPGPLVAYAVAAGCFILALREAIRETRRRLARFKAAQQDREAAFKEYMEELARQAAEKTGP
jgi:membrane protein implicated in regulation of membrane protease activity